MPVESHRILVDSRGHCHVIDLSKEIADSLARCRIRNGTVTLFVIGSTAALSTVEYEPGLVKEDLKAAYERLAPEDGYYLHEETWHDDNGHSHVRATITGPSVTIPLVNGRLTLGTWQQVVLIDFDTRPRKREIVVQVLGE
jgi:secondary thiamine-phosphate synthase enzyme